MQLQHASRAVLLTQTLEMAASTVGSSLMTYRMYAICRHAEFNDELVV